MKAIRFFRMISLIFVLGTLTACQMPSFITKPTPTPTPTPTASPTSTPPPTATKKFTPTIMLIPTHTPNAAATEKYNAMFAVVNNLYDQGYVPSLNGTYIHLNDYTYTWAQLGWYRWTNTNFSPTDFVFKAHMSWESASKTPNASGCGITFHIQPNDEHYVVFVLSNGYIQFAIWTDAFHNQGLQFYGQPDNTGDVDFSMVVTGSKIIVFINDKYIYAYTGLVGKMTGGKLGYTTLSGTNAGYGTRCVITQADLWKIQP
jgi:hypothetical protein